MSEVPERRMRRRWIGLGMAGLLLSACAGTLSDSEDLRVTATDDGLYLFTRSTAIARSVCIASGLDAVRAEGRLFAEGRPHVVDDLRFGSGIQGCQMQPRSLIICQEGAPGCVSGWRTQNSQGWEP
jgi:hypothetical protein